MPQNPYMPLAKANIPEFAESLSCPEWLPKEDLHKILDVFSGCGGSYAHNPNFINEYFHTLAYYMREVSTTPNVYENVLRAIVLAYDVQISHTYTKGGNHDEVRAKVFSLVLDQNPEPTVVEDLSKAFALSPPILQAVLCVASENLKYMLNPATGSIFLNGFFEHYRERAKRETLAMLKHLSDG